MQEKSDLAKAWKVKAKWYRARYRNRYGTIERKRALITRLLVSVSDKKKHIAALNVELELVKRKLQLLSDTRESTDP